TEKSWAHRPFRSTFTTSRRSRRWLHLPAADGYCAVKVPVNDPSVPLPVRVFVFTGLAGSPVIRVKMFVPERPVVFPTMTLFDTRATPFATVAIAIEFLLNVH